MKKQIDADFVSEGESVDLSMIRSAKKLLGNRLLMLVYVAVAFERATMVGLGMFFQKILHIQFHFTEGEASMITGLLIIPGASLGTFLGGYLVKRFNWNCKDILRFSTVVALLSTLLMDSLSWLILEGKDERGVSRRTILVEESRLDDVWMLIPTSKIYESPQVNFTREYGVMMGLYHSNYR